MTALISEALSDPDASLSLNLTPSVSVTSTFFVKPSYVPMDGATIISEPHLVSIPLSPACPMKGWN